MRTRRSLTTAAILALTLTASTLSAANRDTTTGRSSQPDRPSIVMKVKRVLAGIVRAFEGPSIPIPAPVKD